jgi:cytochrome c oxidase subunit II
VAILAAAPGDQRAEYDGVASLYVPIAIAVFVIVCGAILFAVVRYRARPGRPPRATREHNALELGIAGLIAAIVALLVVTTFSAESRIEDTGPRPDLRVDVTAFRWGWRFSYPDLGGIATVAPGIGRPPVLRVPSGAHVHFDLTSRDVIHSFWIPELRYKRQAFPDRHEFFDLRFPEGTAFMGGICATFCGLKHPDMRFSVAVMPPAEFRAWAERQRRAPA